MNTKALINKSFLIFAAFFLSSIAWAVDFPIPDTGQTKCYDYGSEITCPSLGQPFYGQDAQYSCNPHSYTDLGNGIVRDDVTGLEWQQATATYPWEEATSYCEGLLLGGYSDWRMPTIMELAGIVDSSIPSPGPSINITYFPNTVSSSYWSSNTAPSNDPAFGNAWTVAFDEDGKVYTNMKQYDYYVRAVRSGQSGSFGDYVNNGDGTISDTSTGLMWQQATAPGTYIWEEALEYCEDLSLANYDNWRLPNRNELQSLVDYSQYDPSIDTTFFTMVSSSYSYWSSTTIVKDLYSAWIVDFYFGDVVHSEKTSSGHVRAVRAGQCESSDVSTTTTTTSGSTTTTTMSGECAPGCPDSWLGDGVCDSVCNVAACNYDNGDCGTNTTTTTPSGECAPGCPDYYLGDSECDSACNVAACNYDNGDCGDTCTSESIYGGHAEETELLRNFRDTVLSQTPAGQELIKLYYQWSPAIVKAMEGDENIKGEIKKIIDGFLALIGGSE